MVQGKVDGLLRQHVVRHGGVHGVAVRSYVVVNRLGNSIEKESSADPTGEQHRKPGGIVIFWLAVVRTEFDIAVLAEVNDNHEDNPGILKLVI